MESLRAQRKQRKKATQSLLEGSSRRRCKRQMESGWIDEWFAHPKRKQRKERSDKGSSRRKTADGLFDGMPQYVDMNDLDDLGGNPAVDDLNRNFQDADGARSSSAGCADQRPETDTRVDSPHRSMPNQEGMDEAETSSSGRAPEQRRSGNGHSQTRGAGSETADSDREGKAEGG